MSEQVGDCLAESRKFGSVLRSVNCASQPAAVGPAPDRYVLDEAAADLPPSARVYAPLRTWP